MYPYGVCISEINTEIEHIDSFLRSMLTTPTKNIAQDYFDAVSEARSCDFIDHENMEQKVASQDSQPCSATSSSQTKAST